MVPDPSNEKLLLLLVPVPVKENENAVWAFAGLALKMIAAAIGKIQDRYFLLTAAAEHDAPRMEIALTNDMKIPPFRPAALQIEIPVLVYIGAPGVINAKTASRWTEVTCQPHVHKAVVKDSITINSYCSRIVSMRRLKTPCSRRIAPTRASFINQF
jgi:hypothetical protein